MGFSLTRREDDFDMIDGSTRRLLFSNLSYKLNSFSLLVSYHFLSSLLSCSFRNQLTIKQPRDGSWAWKILCIMEGFY